MIRRLSLGLLFLFLLIAAATAWLVGTTSGANLLLRDLLPRIVPAMGMERIEGSLWRGLGIQGFVYSDDAARVTLDRVSWSWDLPGLLDGKLEIATLQLGHLVIEPKATQPAEEDGAGDLQALPIAVHLPEVTINRIEIVGERTSTILEDIHASLAIDPTLRLQVLQLGLVEPRLKLQAQGEVGLDDPLFPLMIELDWQGELPELGEASGHGRVEGSLADLSFEHQLTEPYSLSSSGQLMGLKNESDLHLEAAGEWQSLHWPVSGERAVSSDAGRYRLAGPLQALAVELEGDIALPQLPPGDFNLKATLNPDQIDLASVNLESTAGRLQASGRVGLAPGISWDLELEGDALDPALLGEPWSGQLDLRAGAVGKLESDGPSGRVVLHSLEGVLRDYPFAAQGEVVLSPGATGIRGMQIHSGEAQLTAEGRVLPNLGLELVARAPDLGQLWPGLAGELRGQGRIAGTAAQPQLKGEFVGNGVEYADMRADKLELHLDWPSRQSGEGLVQLVLAGLEVSGEQWKSAGLRLEGKTDAHRLSADLRGGMPELDLVMQGGWDGQAWQGELQRVRSEGLGRGVWENETPAQLLLSTEETRLAPLCLVQGSQSLCLDGEHKADGRIQALVHLKSVDLANLSPLLPPEYALEGKIDGEARVSGSSGHPRIKATLAPTDGRVVLWDGEEEDPLTLRYSDVSVAVEYLDGTLQAEAGFLLQEQARAKVQLALRPNPRGGPDNLQGSVDANLPDLQILAALVPQARIEGGSAKAQLQIGGTVAEPRISGEARVVDTVLEYPDLGLRLEAVRLQLASRGDDRITISGAARSGEVDGEGELTLDGWARLQPDADWPFSLAIDGDRVVAVRLPDSRVLVSPDLSIQGNKRAVEISGSVAVPEAVIEVRELPAGAVTVSGDEVLLGAGVEAESKKGGIDVRGRVALELGDKVSFKGFGLKTRLEGQVDLDFKPGNNRASGSIDLREGSYKSWGQDLSIEQGRLLFAGPVDNPGVDLRALRVSNDGEVKAYLVVSGSLRKPVTQVRTEPATSDTDALSYLLSGTAMGESEGMSKAQLLQAAGSLGLEKTLPALRAIQEDSGLDELGLDTDEGLEGSALVAGKYLTPDLYVRYVQGLFDTSAILSLRYRLSERASVETRSGTTQSVELIYSLEHD